MDPAWIQQVLDKYSKESIISQQEVFWIIDWQGDVCECEVGVAGQVRVRGAGRAPLAPGGGRGSPSGTAGPGWKPPGRAGYFPVGNI